MLHVKQLGQLGRLGADSGYDLSKSIDAFQSDEAAAAAPDAGLFYTAPSDYVSVPAESWGTDESKQVSADEADAHKTVLGTALTVADGTVDVFGRVIGGGGGVPPVAPPPAAGLSGGTMALIGLGAVAVVLGVGYLHW